MAEDYAVHVVRVIDGDSVKVRLPDGDEYSVRMYGIDAPEKDQRAGRDSHDYLRRVVRSRREWRLRVVDVDRYQRLVGVLYPEGGSVRDSANHAMVESGLAYWYREYGGAGGAGLRRLRTLCQAGALRSVGTAGIGQAVGPSAGEARRSPEATSRGGGVPLGHPDRRSVQAGRRNPGRAAEGVNGEFGRSETSAASSGVVSPRMGGEPPSAFGISPRFAGGER